MPKYLRTDSVRLLKASAEALNLALISLAIPPRVESRACASMYASTMGLIGTSAENAMAAVLVQGFGVATLQSSGAAFKSSREILADLKKALRGADRRINFLTIGIPNPQNHLDNLLQCISGFSVTLTERAAGLHAGSGPSREVAILAANRVYKFLEALKLSSRIRPYLEKLPKFPEKVEEPKVLIDDLIARLRDPQVKEHSVALRSLFLVLPEVPQVEPDWLAALERISLVPAEGDLSLLVRTLEMIIPVQLHKVSEKGDGLSVAVRPADPRALPIAPHHLRRSFTKVLDQWRGDVGNANGRLGAGILDLPPCEFVIELFGLGREGMEDALGKFPLTAHDVWPFIAASILRQGIAGPYWFLLRSTGDLGQLAALMERAFALKLPGAADRKREFEDGLASIRTSRPLPIDSSLPREARLSIDNSRQTRRRLSQSLESYRGESKGFPQQGEAALKQAIAGEVPIGVALEALLANGAVGAALNYWARVLCEASSEPLDIGPLINVLHSAAKPAFTAARKALRLIDLMQNGPVWDSKAAWHPVTPTKG